MMLTKGSDLTKRQFRKKFMGYDPEEVRYCLAEAAQLIEEQQKAIGRLEAEIAAANANLGREYRNEHVISEVLIKSEALAAKIKADAEQEALNLIERARAEAQRLLEVARAEAEARKAEAERIAAEASRRRDELVSALTEAVARAGAALRGGLDAVAVIETWLGLSKKEGSTRDDEQQQATEERGVIELKAAAD
ncbi:MAG: DivIVA domain-containing protein [Anaerolineae bacterium]